MALDQVQVMQSLGFERFAVVGHDRGARVGHRIALDHPDRVTRLAVLDIVPTYHIFTHVTKELATLYYHWFFLIQPYDLPERMIGADHPVEVLQTHLGSIRQMTQLEGSSQHSNDVGPVPQQRG